MSNVSVFDVAKYILCKTDESMTTMKLQKLVYYCQAWHSTWYDKGLFRETTRAWANGPVVHELFGAHKGKYAISAAELGHGDAGALTVEQKAAIDSVLGTYGPMSATQLSLLTHAEDPWKIARGKATEGSRSDAVITLTSMKEFYSKLARTGVKSADKVHFPAWA